MTTVLVVFDDRGFTTALRLSRVMASMVNTLAGTEEREMNWLRKQKIGPKCQILQWKTVGSTLCCLQGLPVPHVDKGEDAVEGGHQDVCHGQVQQKVIGHAPHAPMGFK